MADYINLQQPEFDEVQTKLKELHEELLTAEKDIRNKIVDLTSIDGGFYAALISEKIACLLDELNGGPIAQLEDVFIGSEQAITFFLHGIMEIDEYQ